MTEAELDALPDVTPGIAYAENLVDGRLQRVPVSVGVDGALFQKEDDGLVVDRRTGATWLVGWRFGVRVKRRISDGS